jgi:hypothetical protein
MYSFQEWRPAMVEPCGLSGGVRMHGWRKAAAPGWRKRRFATPVELVAAPVFVLVALAFAPPAWVDTAQAGAAADRLVTVVSPRPDGLAAGEAVAIRIRLGPGAGAFQAWLGREEITRRFRASGRERVATLRTGAGGLRFGPNTLFVRVRDARGRVDRDTVRFIRVHRVGSYLELGPRSPRVSAGRLSLRVQVPRPSSTVRTSLNGHSVSRALPTLGRRRSSALDADDGLRFGRNRLVVLAFDERGVFDVERRTVVIPRTRPIPAAGAPRRARLRRLVRLDGRRTLRAHRGSTLRFAWRIVRAPRGSRARLRRSRTATPHFRPDQAGEYHVRLVVTEAARGASAAGALAPSSSDTVTVTAVPAVPPVGVTIDTMAGPAGKTGVALGPPINKVYAVDPTVAGATLQLVALNRSNLNMEVNNSYHGNPNGAAALLQAVRALDSGDLVIITTPNGGPAVTSAAGATSLEAAAELIGGGNIDPVAATTAGEGISVIGVPGQQGGTADQDVGIALGLPQPTGAPAQPGRMRGYLQADSSENFTFVNGDYVPFNTVADGTSPTQAAISVGGQLYRSQAISAGQSGFYVLVLDAGTLAFLQDDTFEVLDTQPEIAAADLNEMDALLQIYLGDPGALVFIQSIGNPYLPSSSEFGVDGAWNAMAADQSPLGGHTLFLNALQRPGSSYAFIGPGDAPSALSPWARTASAAASRSAGQLVGLLARNPSSQFYPRISSPAASLAHELPGVAYQTTVPWPERDTRAHRAAIACFADVLDLPMPIESNYTNLNENWASNQTAISPGNLPFNNRPDTTACRPSRQTFKASDYQAVQVQLGMEFRDLATVNDLIPNLQQPLGLTQGKLQDQLKNIVGELNAAIAPPDATASGDSSDIMVDLLYLAAGIPVVGDAFDVTADTLELAKDTTNQPDGSPEVAQFQVAADSLGTELADDYGDAYLQMDHVGDLLRTDWGKLQTAATKAGHEWNIDTNTINQASQAFQGASETLVYQTLFPLAFSLYRFGDQHVNEAPDYQCASNDSNFNPFASEPEGGVTVYLASSGHALLTDVWAFGKANEQFLQSNDIYRDPNGMPSQGLWNDMFANPIGSLVTSPPMPGQLAFDLEVYSRQRVITHDAYYACLVDGQYPPIP